MSSGEFVARHYLVDDLAARVLRAIPLVLAESERYHLNRLDTEDETTWEVFHADAPETCLVQIYVIPSDGATSTIILRPTQDIAAEAVAAFEKQFLRALKRYGFEVQDKTPRIVSSPQVALLAAPPSQRYESLAVRIKPALAVHDLTVKLPTEEMPESQALLDDVEKAHLVIADVGTEIGRRAADLAREQHCPLLLIAPVEAPLPDSLTERALRYGEPLSTFLEALGTAVRATLAGDTMPGAEEEQQQEPEAEEAIPPSSDEEPEEDFPSSPDRGGGDAPSGQFAPLPPLPQPGTSVSLSDEALETRRRIYRRLALNQEAPLISRMHAARVLVASDDPETAAQTFAALIRAADQAPALAREAFSALTELKEHALPAYWELDTSETDLRRLILIAAHLAALGDTETARLRLESLVRHGDPSVRRAAFNALVELNLLSAAQLESLARETENAALRLAAATHLLETSGGTQEAVDVLRMLAASEDTRAAEQAIQELAALEDETAHQALLEVMAEAPMESVRLLAALSLLEAGITEAPRTTLRELAASEHEDIADEAFTRLQRLDVPVHRDNEYLARHAVLPAIQRRAAHALNDAGAPEVVQQLAIDTLLRLGDTDEAVSGLIRLAQGATRDTRLQRWVHETLRELGSEAEEAVLVALAETEAPAHGAALANIALDLASAPETYHRVATWLFTHQQPDRAIELLTEQACDASIPQEEARAATITLSDLLDDAATDTEALVHIVRRSPHGAARSEARQALLRRHPGALPIDFVVDALLIEEQIPDTLQPALETLRGVAPTATQHLVTRIIDPDTSGSQRWLLFTLLLQFSPDLARPALNQIVVRAPTAAVALAGAEHLFDLGHTETAIPVLASLAISAPSSEVRRRAVFRLVERQPETDAVLTAVANRTAYSDTRALIHDFLPKRRPEALLEQFWLTLTTWVERLGLIETNSQKARDD